MIQDLAFMLRVREPAGVEEFKKRFMGFFSVATVKSINLQSFCTQSSSAIYPLSVYQVKVAVLREEGSNGDREMAAAVYAAGMEPWDITMSDLLSGRASLDSFM